MARIDGIHHNPGFTRQNIITTTGSGTWVVPAGVTKIIVEVVGGGAGGLSGAAGGGGGGGAGGYARKIYSVTPGQTYSYLVGTGGSYLNSGTLSWFVSASGLVANGASGNTGGTASGGDLNIKGGDGTSAQNVAGGAALNGGNNPLGFGGRGGDGGGSTNGTNASGYGGGGGGAYTPTGRTGGSGSNGVIIISY